jgi:hypothetical protein
MGPTPGVETPAIPDVVDVLDADDGGRVWARWLGVGFVECVGYYSHFLRLASVSDN